MIISHSHQIIVISNPKAGSKSLEAALAGFQEEPELHDRAVPGLYTRGHMPADELRATLGSRIWNRYYKIAFVRNPWDWFVSQHFYNLQRRGMRADLDRRLSVEDIMDTYELLRSYRGVRWSDSACQNAFLCDSSGDLLVDFTGRFERLAVDFRNLTSRIGFDVCLPHKNASTHRNYRQYFDNRAKRLVHLLYKRDIDRFSYRF